MTQFTYGPSSSRFETSHAATAGQANICKFTNSFIVMLATCTHYMLHRTVTYKCRFERLILLQHSMSLRNIDFIDVLQPISISHWLLSSLKYYPDINSTRLYAAMQ